jgi:Lrp/AsnC family transcriptional regulator for asnA, asnC and gidA
LLANGRENNCDIAKKTGLTKKIVKENIDKMQKMGIITGATIHINYRTFGYKAVAHILINVNSQKADRLTEFLKEIPEIYAVYSRGVKGKIDVVAILKTLKQLDEINDKIKRKFTILEIKTAIWTDVKEMNDNLALIPENRKKSRDAIDLDLDLKEKRGSQHLTIDEIDQKIVDKLSENVWISIEDLSVEIGVSVYSIKRRYEKLKKNGALKVTVQINPEKLGYRALCIFFTVTSNEKSLTIIEKISKIPDIISIMKTTGDYDLQIWAMVQDIDELLSIQNEIGKVPGISRVDIEILDLGDNESWPSPCQYISTF